ncbi:MAG: DUF2231 domain-containing protein [Abitibacteriaceae bacterium]|nr:DUF2231 domain-containing protein [Abditibacteriaceae bacterium]MBV9865714.1 DUF2231 domain-containing protein [Abditibacteriaceae bacterium]
MSHLSWVELHGAITHLPVACLLLVPVFEIGAALLHKPEWRVVSFWLLVVAVVLAVPALATGWITGNDLHFAGDTGASPAIFVQHRLAAFSASGLAIVALAWRVRHHDQLTDGARIACVCLSLAAAGVVGYTGYLGGRMVFGGSDQPTPVASVAAGKGKTGSPTAKLSAQEAKLVAAGGAAYKNYRCQSCHMLAGVGAKVGPDLTHEAQRHPDADWQLKHLQDPQKMVPNSAMPSQADLPSPTLHALAAYLASRQ